MTDTEKMQAIGMNLSRMGNWVADGFTERKGKILTFLNQTIELMQGFPIEKLPKKFVDSFPKIQKELETQPQNEYKMAETLLTWGLIINHHASKLTIRN